MDKPFFPNYTVHVSEFIQEELDARGWTRQDVYDRLGYDKSDCCAFDILMDVKDKNILMDEKLSKGLGYVFTVDPDLFLRLHEAWRTHPLTQALPDSNVTPFVRN